MSTVKEMLQNAGAVNIRLHAKTWGGELPCPGCGKLRIVRTFLAAAKVCRACTIEKKNKKLLECTSKTCSMCGQEKSIQEFPHRYDGREGRRRGECKSCYASAHKQWRLGNASVIRANRLGRYGITKEIFQNQLIRQNFRCLGCLSSLTEKTARIDHCHKTNKFRGLLCHGCNATLGFAKDSPEILRRLQAYLDYQIDKTNIYLIGALKNKRIPDIGNLLRNQGYDVMDEWFTPGEHADTNWQEYEKKRGRTYQEALRGRAATNIFLFDKSYLDLSDVAILVSPAGKSASIELGYAKGCGKFTIIFLDEADPDRYDIMPNVADSICKTETELLETLKNYDTQRSHPQTA